MRIPSSVRCAATTVFGQEGLIRVQTGETELILRGGEGQRLYQSYIGKRLHNDSDLALLPQGTEVYITHGMEDYYQPAMRLFHNDGNPSLMLNYVSHETTEVSQRITQTTILLKDPEYPVGVNLVYTTYNILFDHT